MQRNSRRNCVVRTPLSFTLHVFYLINFNVTATQQLPGERGLNQIQQSHNY